MSIHWKCHYKRMFGAKVTLSLTKLYIQHLKFNGILSNKYLIPCYEENIEHKICMYLEMLRLLNLEFLD